MTTEHEATRTLVKSPPELWAECSDADSLARHLNQSFGEIKITRLEPETAVAWEGDRVSGTVRIEPSAWGTRVTLTAQTSPETVEEPVEVVEHEPEVIEDAVVVEEPVDEKEMVLAEEVAPAPDPVVEPPAKLGLMARFRAFFNRGPAEEAVTELPAEEPAEPEPVAEPEPAATAAPEPEDEAEPEPEPEPAEPLPPAAIDPDAALAAALDSLGQAHHRPFSRA